MSLKIIPTIFKTRNIVPVIFILVILYEYFFQKLDIMLTKCSRNYSVNIETFVPEPVVLNLNRIKQFYLKNEDFFIPSSLKKKEWHNYTQIELDKKRVGIGEQGKPASLPKSLLKQNLLQKYAYNAALSEKIALDRSLPDIRHPHCKKKMYLKSLPTVSVIVPVFNEHWSTLLRTVYSVLNRSPKSLVKELFIVDDSSNIDLDKENFDEHVHKNLPKVRILRLANHSGLVAARLVGARAATADVFVFLDSHTEANVNWLPPLLEPIALDYRTVVVPVIDTISYETFEYKVIDNGARGAFDWELTYMRFPLTPKSLKNLPDPFETPVMMGGLFAISRRFFWELGGYDPDLHNWGGEQYELSFKIWQCGGRMLEVPCSRFGHIFRFFDRPDHDLFANRNFRRVAEVWMDEYAQYVYARRPNTRNADPGDIIDQKVLREKLKCKPFKWFITQIAFDLLQQFPLIEPLPYAEGWIRPKVSPHLCVDGNNGRWDDAFVLKPCLQSDQLHPNVNDDQKFVLTWFNDVKIKSRNICWEFKEWWPGSRVFLFPCHHRGGNQQWRYYEDMKRFVFIGNPTCLDHNPRNGDLFLNFCDNNSKTQLWEIENVYHERLAKWNITNTLKVTGPVEEWKE